ncbi:unnamed protein product [Closterium sp. Yama58-4]|nr:unnamed protein product [Closterium sp. Yama58-4]
MNLASAVGSATERSDGYRDRKYDGEGDSVSDRGSGGRTTTDPSRIEADGPISGSDIDFFSSDRHSSVSSSEASSGIDEWKDSSEAVMSARDGREGVGAEKSFFESTQNSWKDSTEAVKSARDGTEGGGAEAWEGRFGRAVDGNGIRWLGAVEEGRARGARDVSDGSRGDGGSGVGGEDGSAGVGKGVADEESLGGTTGISSSRGSGNGSGLDALRLLLRRRGSERTGEESPPGRAGLFGLGGSERTRERSGRAEEEILRGNGCLGDETSRERGDVGGRDGMEGMGGRNGSREEGILKGSGGFGDSDGAVERGAGTADGAAAVFGRSGQPWNGVLSGQTITSTDGEYSCCYGVEVAGLPADVSEEDTWQMMEGRGGEVVDVRVTTAHVRACPAGLEPLVVRFESKNPLRRQARHEARQQGRQSLDCSADHFWPRDIPVLAVDLRAAGVVDVTVAVTDNSSQAVAEVKERLKAASPQWAVSLPFDPLISPCCPLEPVGGGAEKQRARLKKVQDRLDGMGLWLQRLQVQVEDMSGVIGREVAALEGGLDGDGDSDRV